MGLFDFLKPKPNNNNQFVTEQAFKSNLTKQMQSEKIFQTISIQIHNQN